MKKQSTELDERLVQAEILDTIDEEDPGAQSSRKDLRRLNTLMGSYSWFARLIRALDSRPGILELGPGCGELGRILHRKGICPAGHYRGVDLCQRPDAWPQSWQWSREDIKHVSLDPSEKLIIGNLVLHHFTDKELNEIGRHLQTYATTMIFNEPARYRFHQKQLKFLRIAGLHPITRHDGHVSIHAGFREEELPHALKLDPSQWNWVCNETLRGCYRMVAYRKT